MNRAWDTLTPLCAAAKFLFAQQSGSHVPTQSVGPRHPLCGAAGYLFAQQRVSREQTFFYRKVNGIHCCLFNRRHEVMFPKKCSVCQFFFPKALSIEPEHTYYLIQSVT